MLEILPAILIVFAAIAGVIIFTRLYPVARLLLSAMTSAERRLVWIISTAMLLLSAGFVVTTGIVLYYR